MVNAMRTLELNNVSIRYMTGDFKDIGIKEYLIRKIKGNYHVKEFWADRNITFALEQGDMLGIIGTNGAGKSTLLKAISGMRSRINETISKYSCLEPLRFIEEIISESQCCKGISK